MDSSLFCCLQLYKGGDYTLYANGQVGPACLLRGGPMNLQSFNPSRLASALALITFCGLAAAEPVYMFKKFTPGVKGSFALAASPLTVTFPSVVAGSSSAPSTVSLSNAGASPVSFTSFTASAGFTQTNTCGTLLEPGASCTASVTFSPPATAAHSGNLAIAYDSGRSMSIALAGTGTPASAIGALSSTSLAFSSHQVGTSTPLTVNLSNSGGSALVVASVVSNNAAFPVTQGCTTVAPGAQCVIEVTFSPAAAGAVSGTLTVTDNATGSPRTVSLSGTGLTATASLSTSSVDFGSVPVGTSTPFAVQLNNTGNQALSASAVEVLGSATFTATHDCTSVAAAGHCTANVIFAPIASGAVTGTLRFTTNAPGSPHSVPLSGTGTEPAITLKDTVPSVLASPLVFVNTNVAGHSAATAVRVYNTGAAPLILSSAITPTGDFDVTSTDCSTSTPVAVGAYCTVNVRFSPTTGGARAGTLPISSNAPTYSAWSLSGTGVYGDPYFSNVVLLMHMDGANGSTTFADVKGHSATATGGAAVSTSVKKIGTGALSLGKSDTIALGTSTDFDLSDDFTIEAWVYPTQGSQWGWGILDFCSSGFPWEVRLMNYSANSGGYYRVNLYAPEYPISPEPQRGLA